MSRIECDLGPHGPSGKLEKSDSRTRISSGDKETGKDREGGLFSLPCLKGGAQKIGKGSTQIKKKARTGEERRGDDCRDFLW